MGRGLSAERSQVCPGLCWPPPQHSFPLRGPPGPHLLSDCCFDFGRNILNITGAADNQNFPFHFPFFPALDLQPRILVFHVKVQSMQNSSPVISRGITSGTKKLRSWQADLHLERSRIPGTFSPPPKTALYHSIQSPGQRWSL